MRHYMDPHQVCITVTHSGSQALRYSRQRRHMEKSQDAGAALLYDLI